MNYRHKEYGTIISQQSYDSIELPEKAMYVETSQPFSNHTVIKDDSQDVSYINSVSIQKDNSLVYASNAAISNTNTIALQAMSLSIINMNTCIMAAIL